MTIERLEFMTTNPGKLVEFETRLKPLGVKVEQKDIQYPEIQADTLEEVIDYGLAHLGERISKSARRPTRVRTIGGAFEMRLDPPDELEPPKAGSAYAIEDSGLFVESLGGYPGVYSKALFMAAGAAGLLRLMEPWNEDVKRRAEFKTVIGLYLPDGATRLFKGGCIGTISHEKQGDSGFGFDPVFAPDEQPDTAYGELQTFAEMTREEKNDVSHRGRALKAMVDWRGKKQR